jgi:hypothetical protein
MCGNEVWWSHDPVWPSFTHVPWCVRYTDVYTGILHTALYFMKSTVVKRQSMVLGGHLGIQSSSYDVWQRRLMVAWPCLTVIHSCTMVCTMHWCLHRDSAHSPVFHEKYGSQNTKYGLGGSFRHSIVFIWCVATRFDARITLFDRHSLMYHGVYDTLVCTQGFCTQPCISWKVR